MQSSHLHINYESRDHAVTMYSGSLIQSCLVLTCKFCEVQIVICDCESDSWHSFVTDKQTDRHSANTISDMTLQNKPKLLHVRSRQVGIL